MAPSPQSLKLALLVSYSVLSLNFYALGTFALNIGIEIDPALKVDRECSRTCESKFCGLAPFLRYGKYCGILYTGCPGETPCDSLDSCCMEHDHCIQRLRDYLSQACNEKFLTCVGDFLKRKGRPFSGNTCPLDEVVEVMNKVIHAAIIAGRIIHKP